MEKVYPDFFPDGCPPSSAYEDNAIAYRYTKNNPPINIDFISCYELNPKKWRGKIDAYGLSVISNYDSALNALNQSPFLRKKFQYISKGLIIKESGVMKKTPSLNMSKHVTWWVCKNYNAHENFICIPK